MRFKEGVKYIGSNTVGQMVFLLVRRTEKTLWLVNELGDELKCRVTALTRGEVATPSGYGIDANAPHEGESSAKVKNIMDAPVNSCVDASERLSQDKGELLKKLKTRLAKIEELLEKNRTSTLMDGWQTSKFARKSRNWDYYAKMKHEIRNEIHEIEASA